MTVYKMILRRCKTINVVYTASDRNQASVERRRPRRPGFSNLLLPSWDSWFLSFTKHEDHERKTRTKNKIQDGEDVDVLRSPDWNGFHCLSPTLQ